VFQSWSQIGQASLKPRTRLAHAILLLSPMMLKHCGMH
jgi:hypothetical protein